jgi:hypothetical protein
MAEGILRTAEWETASEIIAPPVFHSAVLID